MLQSRLLKKQKEGRNMSSALWNNFASIKVILLALKKVDLIAKYKQLIKIKDLF